MYDLRIKLREPAGQFGKSMSLCNQAADEITRLKDRLEQIATVCRDNAGSTCDKGMALDFVRQIAER